MIEPVFPCSSGRRMKTSWPDGGGAFGVVAHAAVSRRMAMQTARLRGIPRGQGAGLRLLIHLHCEAGSPVFTAKWVPRTPIEAVGVSNRSDSGASFPMRPEREAIVPLVSRALRPSFPCAGVKRKLWLEK